MIKVIGMTWYPGKIIGDVFRGGGNISTRDLEIALKEFEKEYRIDLFWDICDHLNEARLAVEAKDWKDAEYELQETRKWLDIYERQYKEKLLSFFERVKDGREYVLGVLDTIKYYIRFLEDAIRVEGDHWKLGMDEVDYDRMLDEICGFCVETPFTIYWVCGAIYALTMPLEKL